MSFITLLIEMVDAGWYEGGGGVEEEEEERSSRTYQEYGII
jgi:hypothetical protein